MGIFTILIILQNSDLDHKSKDMSRMFASTQGYIKPAQGIHQVLPSHFLQGIKACTHPNRDLFWRVGFVLFKVEVEGEARESRAFPKGKEDEMGLLAIASGWIKKVG